MRIHRYRDTGLFLDRARPFLMHAEAENSMMLGMGVRALDDRCYLATVEDGREVVACAVRTPPYGLVITQAVPEALDPLVQDVALAYESVPSVMGPEPSATAFASRWEARKGTRTRALMRMQLYEARAVHSPAPLPPGRLRPADESELSLMKAWVVAFHEEAATRDPLDPERMTRDDIANQRLYVWDHDGAVSIAKCASRTDRSARIGLAYTPPEHRCRGYASALVAGLTQRLLDEGLVFCSIVADVANRTTNRIYPAIGYRPVCETSHIDLNAAAEPPR
jgi:predicted GNAT family acetyltransferase